MTLRLYLCLISLGLGFSFAQQVTFELGFNEQIIADEWNPLRLQLRDHPAVTFTLNLDQGDLRGGEIPAIYTIDLARQQGITVFEDDIYLPKWRSLSWKVESAERIIASGSYSRRQAIDTPLSLILSTSPNKWLELFEDERPTEAISHLLPDRVASYDGVKNILLDGTVSTPKLEPLVAAVTAGTSLILVDPLPDTYADIASLATNKLTRLGAGLIIRAPASELAQLLRNNPNLAVNSLEKTLQLEAQKAFPTLPSQYPVMISAGLFVLAIMIILRFGGNITLTTSILLTAIASLLAWTWLRPDSATAQETTNFSISAGGLAYQQSFDAYVSLPANTVELPFYAFPNLLRPYIQTAETLNLELGRWSNLVFIKKPNLRTSQFYWQENELVFPQGITSAFIKGAGIYPSDARQTRPTSSQSDILSHLPIGAALATNDTSYFIALPELTE